MQDVTQISAFSLASLERTKQFDLAFPGGSALVGAGERKGSMPLSLSAEVDRIEEGSAVLSLSPGSSLLFPPSLAWSHDLVLLRVTRPEARAFYEIEAARESWSVRELERQVGALLFDRLTNKKSPEEVLALVRKGQQVSMPSDVLKDPFVLEFADLGENPAAQERDLEQAIIDRREDFLLEMGKGFCAELVATCVACDETDETKRWAAALQVEYKRFPALRDELERAARAP